MAIFGKKRTGKRSALKALASPEDVSYIFDDTDIDVSRDFRHYVEKELPEAVRQLIASGSARILEAEKFFPAIDERANGAASDLSRQHQRAIQRIESNTLELQSYMFRLQEELTDVDEEIVRITREIEAFEQEPPQRRRRSRRSDNIDPDTEL